MTIDKDISAKPFLRWVGGKTWLKKHLNRLIGNIPFNNYHEPFLGGGAIFFALAPQGVAYLSDLNQELIDTYIQIKENPSEVICVLKSYQNTKEFYYGIRSIVPKDPVTTAARFIYLNQTSFNGIFRVNQRGEYNVPYGYRQKNFLEEDIIMRVSHLLQSANLTYGDFDHCRPYIAKGDLVFLDPPYTVSHNNNGFIKYNQKLFSLSDQERLSQFIEYIKDQDAYYILANAAHKTIEEIFTKPGDYKYELSRASLIGGENAKRGHITEYIFTNLPEGQR